ncbi:YihY/virulence factor BrkB family protein [Schaalia sp. ZJ405]|uniref:YhjD/YihY/BrkB family envelope integrity protein n=1 Tax=unclassified Schaalia TaxID=2691889 RepID=UPI0013EBAA7E|nr:MULTISPECIES: YhjD/YihY/BrkB family envelope integrity protein [unclassified Schaalia]QPK80884.1 YihY/virulence factor BrkB family protein [Schaalia sp. ZJ405]
MNSPTTQPQSRDSETVDDLGLYTTPEDCGLEAPRLTEALGAEGFPAKAAALGQWWAATRLARALTRYNQRNGTLLTGGMALTALTSLTAALTVAITIFMLVLGDNEQLRTAFFETIDSAVPNLLKTPTTPDGLVDPHALIMSNAVSVTGIVALAIMAWSAIGVVGQLGNSIRAMFSIGITPGNPVIKILMNALGALGLGVGLIASAGLGILVSFAGDWLLGLVGLAGSGFSAVILRILTEVISFGVYFFVTWLLIRVVSRVRVPKHDLYWGLAIIALISIVLRNLGTSVVGAVSGPLLATAATLITLVLWLNLQVRVVLTGCAWMANPPKAHAPATPRQVHFMETPNYVSLSAPHTLQWPHNAISGEVMPDELHEAAAIMLGDDH